MALRIAALLFLVVTALPQRAAAGDGDGEVPEGKQAVINAWVVDIPSPATVTKIEGVIVILNRVERRYELLKEGKELVFDDIVRMVSEGTLEVRYEDGSKGTFDFKDYPEDRENSGTWLVFKEKQ